MSERWTKIYENALTDEKYLAIAGDTGASRLLIGATFTKLLLYTGAHHPDTGSCAGFDLRVWAAWAEAPAALVERVIVGLREYGLLAGNAIANWAKRQGAAVVAAAHLAKTAASEAEAVITAAARRTRRWRQKKKRDPRQQEMFFTISGGAPGGAPGGAQTPQQASPEASPRASPQASHPVTRRHPEASPRGPDREEITVRESPLEAPPAGEPHPLYEITDGGIEILPPLGSPRYARRRRSSRPTKAELIEAGRARSHQAWMERAQMAGGVGAYPTRTAAGYG